MPWTWMVCNVNIASMVIIGRHKGCKGLAPGTSLITAQLSQFQGVPKVPPVLLDRVYCFTKIYSPNSISHPRFNGRCENKKVGTR